MEREYDSTNQIQAQTEWVKCEGCGSNMVFDPQKQALNCPHCGSQKSFAQDKVALEQDFALSMTTQCQWSAEETAVYECDNCGASVVFSILETAMICPFCGTSHVRKTSELAGIKPTALIPFAFNKDKALEYTKAWAKKRLYAPRAFKKNVNTQNLGGAYMPCFTFDSTTTSYYEGKLGETRTRTVGTGKNSRTETYTVWFHVSGVYNDAFDDVTITAGKKFEQKDLEGISPYDTNNSKTYEEEYMLGFSAYHYDKEIGDCWNGAKGKMDATIRKRILNKYYHDKVAYLNVTTTHSNVTFKYVMLPVYVGNFKFKEKLFNFFVNGSTGKVAGKTPKSVWKILLTVLAGLILIGGIVLIIHFFG